MKKVVIPLMALSMALTVYANELDYQTVTVGDVSVQVPAEWEMLEYTQNDDDRTTKYYEDSDFYLSVERYDSSDLGDLDEYNWIASFSEWIEGTFDGNYFSYTEVETKDLSSGDLTALWETVISYDEGYEITDSICYFRESNVLSAIRMCSYHSYESERTSELLGIMEVSINSFTVESQLSNDTTDSYNLKESLNESESTNDEESYALESENEELKNRVEELENEEGKLEEEIESLELENEEIESENEELKSENEALESENGELRSENETLESENEELKSELHDLEDSTETETEIETENQKEKEASQTEVVGEEYTDSTIIKMVQQALNEAGYNCGTADGVAGSKTIEAINSYEKSKGLNVNGVITDELLESLGIADTVAENIEKEAMKQEYSSEYTYTQLARDPDSYIGVKMVFKGKVLQTGDAGTTTKYLRLAINSNSSQVIFVTYDESMTEYNILEDDVITIYGMGFGEYSYTAVLGNEVTIPWVNADIVDMSDVSM